MILSPAELNEQTTRELHGKIENNFLDIGILLVENRDKKYWSMCGHESFKEYLESLGFHDVSKAYVLMEIATYEAMGLWTREDLKEMGITRARRILPLARSGEDWEDWKIRAMTLSDRELRKARNFKVVENDERYTIVCQHCGNTLYGVKYVQKEKP